MMVRPTVPLLAVDGGGTKCRVAFVDRERNILANGRAGSCNYQGVGREAAMSELFRAIGAALSALKTTAGFADASAIHVECAVFALAGLDTAYDREVVEAIVHEVLVRMDITVNHLLIENDGFAVLLGATNGAPGVLVIAGTGSIAFGNNAEGVHARAGGWGHRVGDEGSGYWIGKMAITAILHAVDGRGPATSLPDWVLPHLGLSHPEELFNWSYGEAYSVEKVGELSRLVSMAAAAADRVAENILKRASDELFAVARAVIDRLGMKEQAFTIILQGGVLQNDAHLRQMVMDKCRSYTPYAEFDTAKNEAIYGVIDMGLAHLQGK